ncbi:complement C1q-like protein 4 [Melanotaenia boesemani]|uniref:complement C1q-like protein 4 n=1 Tax=Melanotaenia boesemani TaxID=1250792 RepID=UPI001C03E2BB|nr:complement C1q-like protein 4 [Melanotaenia boesemani]
MMSCWVLVVFLACGLVQAQVQPDNLLQQLTDRVEKLEKEREDRVRSQVAFSAALLATQNWTNVGPFQQDKTLDFKTVKTNVGNAYNSETGIFTAPVKGLYYFHFTGVVGSSGNMNAGLKKNGINLVAIHHKAGTQASASNSIALELVPGDRVYVQLWAGQTMADQSRLTTFTGFLVFPM